MAKVVVLGLAGEDGLWVADLEAGTVVPMAADTSGAMQTSQATRKAGVVTTKGVDYAVSVSTASESAAGLYEAASGLYES